MDMYNYVEEEDDELVSDLLVVAKFAQLDVRPNDSQENAVAVEDPQEIVLSEDENGLKGNDDDMSETSSSSSSSSDDEADDDKHSVRDADEFAGSGESDDEEGPNSKNVSKFGPMTRNELPYDCLPLDPLPPQTTLMANDIITETLKVTALQGNTLVASSLRSPVLDTGSVISTKDRILVGRVDDVFGPVTGPFYTVRIMNMDVKPNLQINDVLCWVEKFSVFVNPAALNARGTDASNMVDEELEEEEDASDDDSDVDQPDISRSPRAAPLRRQPPKPQQPRAVPGSQQRGREVRRSDKSKPHQYHRPAAGVINSNSAPALPPVFPVSSTPIASNNAQQPTVQMPAPAQPRLPPGWPTPSLPPGWPAPKQQPFGSSVRF